MSDLARCDDVRSFFEDWRKAALRFDRESLRLYAVTDRREQPLEVFYRDVERALKGGVTLVQLREKKLDRATWINEAKDMVSLCHRYGVPLIVNDDLDVALAAGADGVHLGREDISVAEARKKAPADFIIGATAKTVAQAKEAEKNGADYLGVGAIFPSPTKRDAIRVSKDQLKEICESVSIPAVAIGGINEENIGALKGAPVAGFAVVSAVFGQDDVFEAARLMRTKAEEILG